MIKVKIPIFITIIVGIFMIAKFFLNVLWIKAVADELEQWGMIVLAMAIVLGVANILRVNLKTALKKGKDWQYKLVVVISMMGMILVGLWDLAMRGHVSAGSEFQYLFDVIYTPLSATMFALLAFYVASAAFRAFRARNVGAALLLVSGALVMIGRVPLSAAISGYLPKIADWIMAVPNAAGQRGLIIGAAMGVIATGLRIIFGIERPYLRGE
ncbi:hypothetical protein JW926_11455 [Candidatus Sumerlaeota bacterium]|nr:hypothetical protein [Candidatus Sumerlaeota bacterium]